MTAASRWWTYQRERFPLLRTSALVASFAAAGVFFSAFLRSHGARPSLASFAVAFLTALGFFALLRITDEHKDFEEDLEFRPYRPVQRGLVRLSELRWIGLGIAAMQLALAVALAPKLLVLLAITWTYLALMTKEFFARRWLKAHPIAYLLSHMLIMPLVDFYTTACDWMPTVGHAPDALAWFIAMSFFNGIVLEIGRKLRAPEDEERGVETYTALYGRPKAIAGWLLAMVGAGVSAIMAGADLGLGLPIALVVAAPFVVCVATAAAFLRQPTHRASSLLESVAGLWVLVAYLSLAIVPVVAGR